MKNIEITTQKPEYEIRKTEPQTIGDWFVNALPSAMTSALEEQRKFPSVEATGISLRRLALAAVSHSVKELDNIALLPSILQGEAVGYLSIRTMAELLEKEEREKNIALLREGYELGIDAMVDGLSIAYFGARIRGAEDGEELHRAIAEAIRTDYAALSPAEIREAFALAAKDDAIKAYGGKMTVQILHRILKSYKEDMRGKALAILLDKERALDDAKNEEETRKLNEAAYQKEVRIFQILRKTNMRHESFYSCPHWLAKRFVAEGVIGLQLSEKKEIMALARAYLAYDIKADSKRIDEKRAVDNLVKNVLKIEPKRSPRVGMKPELLKLLGVQGFNYKKCTQEEFEKSAVMYYSKLLYFKCLAPFSGDSKGGGNA